jgi:hypothetical protein
VEDPPKTWKQRFRRLLPWLSLSLGLATAVLMERSAERAPIVVLAAGAGWMLVAAFVLAARYAADRAGVGPLPDQRRRVAEKIAELSEVAGIQALVQHCVFFTLPFYVRASSPRIDHAVFLLILAAAGATTLWDPFFERLIARGPWRGLLQATAAFAGLNCTLPMLGLSNRLSLYAAAGLAVLGSPLLVRLGRRAREGVSKRILLEITLASLVPFLAVIAAAPAIPPAPLELEAIAIGTRVADKTLVDPTDRFTSAPPQLACYTRIAAPRGLSDALFHVWRRNGVEVDRIPLALTGGRRDGFRTWSIKKRLGEARGTWTCAVETAVGQALGSKQVEVTP